MPAHLTATMQSSDAVPPTSVPDGYAPGIWCCSPSETAGPRLAISSLFSVEYDRLYSADEGCCFFAG